MAHMMTLHDSPTKLMVLSFCSPRHEFRRRSRCPSEVVGTVFAPGPNHLASLRERTPLSHEQESVRPLIRWHNFIQVHMEHEPFPAEIESLSPSISGRVNIQMQDLEMHYGQILDWCRRLIWIWILLYPATSTSHGSMIFHVMCLVGECPSGRIHQLPELPTTIGFMLLTEQTLFN